jgi:hypothetical protein
MFGNHTRQTTIIRLRRGLVWASLLWTPGVVTAQPTTKSDAVACITCVILHVRSASERVPSIPPEALRGLTIVVDRGDVAPGVLGPVPGAASPPHFIVPDLGRTEEAIFRLRTMVTGIRASMPDARVLLDGPDVTAALAAYVDGRVARGPTLETPDVEQLVAASLVPSPDPWLITLEQIDDDVLAGFVARRALSSEVVGSAALSVEEILARHQAVRRRQESHVRETIGRGTTALMFEVPGFVAPVTITAQTTIFRQPGLTEMVQRDIRVNGAAIAGGSASSPPQLPLIEPERVATPPLVITLTDEYRYRLEGRERIDGADAYVVSFDPMGLPPEGAGHEGGVVGSDFIRKRPGTLASGRAWIDATSFALRRLHIVQQGLSGAIVSSEQHEDFGPFDAGPQTVWLPVRTRVFQMYEGAGHRTPIHRTIETPAYEINPPGFRAELEAAYASPDLMLRETPEGFRYLLRRPGASATTARTVATRAGERIRTAVFGVLIDPNIADPLPFAGINYVDLNLLDRGAQLNVFFGGTYGQLSWSVPSVGGTRWQAHGRAFGIAARYNDRAFDAGVEQYAENITQRPAHVSAALLRSLSSRWRARVGYELDYTAFDRADTTAAAFVVPADALVHGLRATLEGESGPWTARLFWNPAVRQRWEPWGMGGDERSPRSFQRYGMVVARTLGLGPTVGSRVEAAWMDGVDLDRFSRYSFDAFENRLRGYPTASIRYDRGAVARTVTSWSGRGWRIDAFGDMALVRDPGFGPALRGYPGVAAAFEAGGPLRTLWSVEWGYGFRARRADGGRGTQALRITGYRTF